MMMLPRKQVILVTQRQTHQGINHCLCIQSVDPCITTGHEQQQETRKETGAVWRNGHSECQTGRFEERIQHAGNINCRVNLSQQNCCSYKKPFRAVSVTIHNIFALVCTCFLHFEASLNHFRNTISHRLLFVLPKPFQCQGQKEGIQFALMFQKAKKKEGRKNIGTVTLIKILTIECIEFA